MKAVIYSRVSSQEQSTDNQISVLKGWSEHRGYDLVKVYQEAESAWKAGHQRELSRLIDDAKKGKFDIVLVWSLDRVSREGALAILELINNFSKWGIKLLSYQETWTDAPGELAELLYALAGWVARMESQRRSERTKAGLARVRREGKVIGRPEGSKDSKKRSRRGYLLRYAK